MGKVQLDVSHPYSEILPNKQCLIQPQISLFAYRSVVKLQTPQHF